MRPRLLFIISILFYKLRVIDKLEVLKWFTIITEIKYYYFIIILLRLLKLLMKNHSIIWRLIIFIFKSENISSQLTCHTQLTCLELNLLDCYKSMCMCDISEFKYLNNWFKVFFFQCKSSYSRHDLLNLIPDSWFLIRITKIHGRKIIRMKVTAMYVLWTINVKESH